MALQVEMLSPVQIGDEYVVPRSSKGLRKTWGSHYPGIWIDLQDNHPWWHISTDTIFKITGLYKKRGTQIWVPIWVNADIHGWMRLQDIIGCTVKTRGTPTQELNKPPLIPLELPTLKPHMEVFDAIKKLPATVLSWESNRLPTPEHMACVTLQSPVGKQYQRWLSDLRQVNELPPEDTEDPIPLDTST